METDIQREEDIRNRLEEIKNSFLPTEENKNLLFSALSDESWRVRKDAVSLAVANPIDEVIDILIKGLSSEENAGLRNACQEALTKIGENVIDKLIKSFSNADRDVRKFIIDIVGDIGVGDYAGFLIEALNDSDENVVISACENLGKLRNEIAIEPLLKRIDPKNEWLSFVIIEALSQIGKPFDAQKIIPLWEISQLRKPILDIINMFDEKSRNELLKRAFEDKSFYVQENAAKALYRIFKSKEDSLKKLQDVLEDVIIYKASYSKFLKGVREDEFVFALLSFLSKDSQFFLELIEKAGDEALNFFGNLGSYGKFNNPSLIIDLVNKYEGKIQAYLTYLIGLFRIEEGFPILNNLCKAEYGHTRQAVAFSLGRIEMPDAINCLFALLEDRYKDVRDEAVKSLSKKITKENFPLEKALQIFAEGDREKVISILSLMERVGYFNEKLIVMALRDINPQVRAKAIKLISNFKLKDFIHDVSLLLADEDEEVRYEAILCMGNIVEDPEKAEFLVPFLEDESNNIKKAAIRSILNISKDFFIKVEDKVFNNINPLLYLFLIDMVREGAPLNMDRMVNIAEQFDDYDLYRELIRAIIDSGDIEGAKEVVLKIDRDTGKANLMEEFKCYLEEAN